MIMIIPEFKRPLDYESRAATNIPISVLTLWANVFLVYVVNIVDGLLLCFLVGHELNPQDFGRQAI